MTTKKQPIQKPIVDDGYEIVKPAALKPFINWEKQPEIEGIVSNFREIDGDYGLQSVCDVGDFSVGITSALGALLKLEGVYLKIRFEGLEESSKGRQFKNFTILRRKEKPAA